MTDLGLFQKLYNLGARSITCTFSGFGDDGCGGKISITPELDIPKELYVPLRDFFDEVLDYDLSHSISFDNEGCEGHYELNLEDLTLQVFALSPHCAAYDTEDEFCDEDNYPQEVVCDELRPFEWQSKHEQFAYQAGLCPPPAAFQQVEAN